MTPWSGVTCCCLSAAALYLYGRSCESDAEFLKSVTRVDKLKDLGKLVPLVVAVFGRVCSDTPITCEHSGMRSVIVKETAKQYFLKQEKDGSWIRDSALMQSKCKEVPWYLDDGTGRVYVVGAQDETDLVLTVSREVFEKSGKSLVGGTSDNLQGLKMLGLKRTERVLRIGTPLTVVGKAVKDNAGTIRIRCPFYVSSATIDQLIANLGGMARFCKYASVGFMVFGVFLIAEHAFQYIMERRQHWNLRKRVLGAAAKRPRSENKVERGSDAAKEDRLRPDLCVICFEQEYNSVFVPCGHMCCCLRCSSRLTKTECPLCRRRIDQVVKTFRN